MLNGNAKFEMADRFRDGFLGSSAPASNGLLKGRLGGKDSPKPPAPLTR
jgi:hypothetical protein